MRESRIDGVSIGTDGQGSLVAGSQTGLAGSRLLLAHFVRPSSLKGGPSELVLLEEERWGCRTEGSGGLEGGGDGEEG
jgi:hypothetical protein